MLYNIDNIDKSQPLIFVEGEIDALTLLECGITNCVSVPTGAPIKVSEVELTHQKTADSNTYGSRTT